jgi:hypothetical protein
MIRITIHAAEALWYYHVRLSVRIYLYKKYLHALTPYSVIGRIFHYRVTPSKLKRVLEY